MSSLPPVPSNGALRTLRFLALGTSCTVVVCTGVLAEERRRRINTASELASNSKKLKSSRNYYSGGAAAIEAFRDKSLGDGADIHFWGKPGNFTLEKRMREDEHDFGYTTKMEASAGGSITTSSAILPPPTLPRHKVSGLGIMKRGSKAQLNNPILEPPLKKSMRTPIPRKLSVPEQSGQGHRPISPSTGFIKPSSSAYLSGIRTVLSFEPPDLYKAEKLIGEAFDQGYSELDGNARELLHTAAQIVSICYRQKDLTTARRVFKMAVAKSFMDATQYDLFQPEFMIQDLVHGYFTAEKPDPERIREACSIFLARPKENRAKISPQLSLLGTQLLDETSRLKDDLCEKLLAYMRECNGDKPLLGVGTIVKAYYTRKEYGQVARAYAKLCNQTILSNRDFFLVTSMAIESALSRDRRNETRRLRDAEDLLGLATEIAQIQELGTSSTWFLKVLDQQWNLSRGNVTESEEMFRRLSSLLNHTHHPRVVYGWIIRRCVESKAYDLALSHCETMNSLYPTKKWPTDQDNRLETQTSIRIHSYIALARANSQDWTGVRESLVAIREAGEEGSNFGNIAFATVLRSFAKSHTISETEEFFRECILKLDLKIVPHVQNIMIDSYAKAKEMDSIVRLVQLTAQKGVLFNSTSFNTMLTHFSRAWGFTWTELEYLVAKVSELQKRDPRTKAPWALRQSISKTENDQEYLQQKRTAADNVCRIIDEGTISILEHAALVDDQPIAMKQNKMVALKQTIEAQKKRTSEVSPFLHETRYLSDKSPQLREESRRDLNGAYNAMNRSFAMGEFEHTLQVYEEFIYGKEVTNASKHLVLAIKAALHLYGQDYPMIGPIIKRGQELGCNTNEAIEAIFIFKAKLIRREAEENESSKNTIMDMHHNTLAALKQHGLRIDETLMRRVTTTTMSLLQEQGHIRETLQLWESTCIKLRISKDSADVPTLTVILKACVQNKNIDGIAWVVKIMEANQLFPDTLFVNTLKEARRRILLWYPFDRPLETERLLAAILTALEKIRILRKDGIVNKQEAQRKTLMIIEQAIRIQTAKNNPNQELDSSRLEESISDVEDSVGSDSDQSDLWSEHDYDDISPNSSVGEKGQKQNRTGHYKNGKDMVGHWRSRGKRNIFGAGKVRQRPRYKPGQVKVSYHDSVLA